MSPQSIDVDSVIRIVSDEILFNLGIHVMFWAFCWTLPLHWYCSSLNPSGIVICTCGVCVVSVLFDIVALIS